MSQENLDLVRSAYEAYNHRDVEGVLRRFDPTIDWNVPSSLAWGGHVTGIEAVTEFFQRLRPYMGDQHQVAIDGFLDAGDRVVALVRHVGVAPDGQPYEVPSIMVWTVAGGRLTALYEQLDTLAMARATEGVTAA
jgi:ketosteroid isomerase-like protein